MPLSFWERNSYFENTGVIIIGSGIVGLNAALYLKKKDPALKIVILERGFLPTGASTKNAGFCCFGSSSELLDDLKKHSENEVFSLVEKRYKGLKRLRKNLGDKAIDYLNLGGHEVFDDEEKFERCVDRLNYLNKKVYEAIGKKNTYSVCNDQVKKQGLKNFRFMISNRYEGQIDTGKMMLALIKKVQQAGIIILNGVEVNAIRDEGKKVTVQLQNDIVIDTKKILVCTNGFARQLLPELNVTPARSQVLITSPIKHLQLKGSFHFDEGYIYFRNINNRVLLGGGRNINFKGEATNKFGLTDEIQHYLEKILANNILPSVNYKIEQRWSGIMGLGDQKTTIVKAVSENVYCAVRMGGMGIAIGSLVGEEAAALVNGSKKKKR